MMNKLELLEKRNDLINDMKAILNRCKEQKRELLKVEDEEFRNIQHQVEDIDNKIMTNKQNESNINNMNSLFRNLLQANKGELSDIQKEVKQELRRLGQNCADNEIILNVRAVTPTGGGDLVPVAVNEVAPQLAEQGFIARAGGHVVAIPSDFVIPTVDGMSLSWEEEDGTDTTATSMSIAATKLVLQRLSGAFTVDKKIFDVASPSLEAAITDTIYALIDAKVNEKAVKAMEKSTQTVTGATGASNYALLVEAEGKLLGNNVNPSNIVYIYNPADLAKIKADSRQTNEATSILDKDNLIGGRMAIASSYVTAGKIIACDASQLWANIAYVGLIVDEYTLAHKGQNRVCVNAYGDASISNVNKYAVVVTLATQAA